MQKTINFNSDITTLFEDIITDIEKDDYDSASKKFNTFDDYLKNSFFEWFEIYFFYEAHDSEENLTKAIIKLKTKFNYLNK